VTRVPPKTQTTGFVPPIEELQRSLHGATAADVVLVVQECLRVGVLDGGIAICEAARGLGLVDPGLTLVEATARFGAGQRPAALALVDAALDSAPAHPAARYLKARMLLSLGRHAEARELLLGVIERWPDFPGAQAVLSTILMPGPPYREVLARVHRALRPDTYLEIGVEAGVTLALATTASIAAGVDPAACPPGPLRPGAPIYRVESDVFFARETLATVFQGRPVQLAFIDGMHWFEYALRDFSNAERWSARDGTIVIHDCLPVTPVAAQRERSSTFWVGDVWKVLEALLDYRPDLRIRVVPTAPSGLVIVQGLDPSSRVLSDAMDAIVARYRDLEYPHSPGRWPDRFNLVENSDAGLARALAG
jgi:tetratricopeptide (TPR) repeat protein